MSGKVIYPLISIILLSVGWLGISGLPLLVAFVPLLILSERYSDSARDFWRMAGWATLTFVLWNVATIWWVWIATPIGPITATIVSSFWSLLPFMLYHYVSKRAPRVLAYTLLVAGWVAAELFYTSREVMSFPWLTIGNGFSADVWAVQWYEWTGVLGGSVWVWLCNIAIFELLRQSSAAKRRIALAVVALPLIVSLVLYCGHKSGEESVTMSVIQPNVDCYDEKFSDNSAWQMENMISLLRQVPQQSRVAVLPETALPEHLRDSEPQEGWSVQMLREELDSLLPNTMLITGATTIKYYAPYEHPTSTARRATGGYFYDVYNSAIAINGKGERDVHHKMRLVIGVEAMPELNLLNGFVDLGGMTGQLGRNHIATNFANDVVVGPAICYEGLYGDCFARFVREGAEAMTVLSNDGWWGNTSGHKRLFDFCRLRAIECRRAVARSANTGVSGFITSRGDVVNSLGWEQRGVLTHDVEVRDDMTLYVRYGDWVGRLAQLLTFLGILYYTAYRVRRRNHFVD